MVTIRIQPEALSLTFVGLALAVFLQLSIDIPGIDIPDLKDLPDMMTSFEGM